MDDPRIEILGFVAGAICTSAAFPQIWKVTRTKTMASMSWGLVLANFIGVTMYMIYGILISKPAIWVNLAVSSGANCVLVLQKGYYDHWRQCEDRAPITGDFPASV
jgi:uncharacterized protein with PQ loop repeat